MLTTVFHHEFIQDIALNTSSDNFTSVLDVNSVSVFCHQRVASIIRSLDCTRWLVYNFYRAMLRKARLCHSMSSVCLSACLSVWNVHVCFSHRLEYFEENFTADLNEDRPILSAAKCRPMMLVYSNI